MGKADLKFTERDDISPICPFCQKWLDEIYVQSKGVGVLAGRNVVYFCPFCSKVLGFGQSRMM